MQVITGLAHLFGVGEPQVTGEVATHLGHEFVMAGHDLIDAYLAAAARCLPGAVVDELADGLVETYQRQRSDGLDADSAAKAAIVQFGDLDLVLAAFVRQSPGQKVARILLCSGPVVGACWGWHWSPDTSPCRSLPLRGWCSGRPW
jgi:hypothetical protein